MPPPITGGIPCPERPFCRMHCPLSAVDARMRLWWAKTLDVTLQKTQEPRLIKSLSLLACYCIAPWSKLRLLAHYGLCMPASRCLWWLLTLYDGVDGVGIVALMAGQWCSLCISAVYCIRDLLDACAEALVLHSYPMSERGAWYCCIQIVSEGQVGALSQCFCHLFLLDEKKRLRCLRDWLGGP